MHARAHTSWFSTLHKTDRFHGEINTLNLPDLVTCRTPTGIRTLQSPSGSSTYVRICLIYELTTRSVYRLPTSSTCDQQFHNLAHLCVHTHTCRLQFKQRVCVQYYLELECLCDHHEFQQTFYSITNVTTRFNIPPTATHSNCLTVYKYSYIFIVIPCNRPGYIKIKPTICTSVFSEGMNIFIVILCNRPGYIKMKPTICTSVFLF